jgi:hypothetical protein
MLDSSLLSLKYFIENYNFEKDDFIIIFSFETRVSEIFEYLKNPETKCTVYVQTLREDTDIVYEFKKLLLKFESNIEKLKGIFSDLLN